MFFIRSRDRTWKFSLVLHETRDFLDDLSDEEDLRQRYTALLASVFGALFSCQPERPPALLIAETVAPGLHAQP